MTTQKETQKIIADLEKFKDSIDAQTLKTYNLYRTLEHKHDPEHKKFKDYTANWADSQKALNDYFQLSHIQLELIALLNKLHFDFRDLPQYNLKPKQEFIKVQH